MWFLLALTSALFQSANQTFAKHFQTKHSYLILASFNGLVAGLILICASYFRGFPILKTEFVNAVIISAVVNIIAIYFYFGALRKTDLSLVSPMFSLTPVFLTLTGYFILGESPSPLGILGILMTVGGIYFLNLPPKSRDPLAPLMAIQNNRGVLFMFIVAALYSISAPYDKVATLNSDFLFAPAMVCLSTGTFFFIFTSITYKKEAYSMYRKGLKYGILTGASFAISLATINLAYLYTLAVYAISVKRSSALFSILFGKVVFKEQQIRKRFAAALIALAGVIIIALS